jgi:HNH endonuclease/AP2 domain
MITLREAKKLLGYDPATGAFTWMERTGRTRGDNIFNARFAGKEAGRKNADDYVNINYKGTMLKAHRLAWLLMTGKWPSSHIDHINGIKSDNRWVNLREATQAENGQNCKTHRHNTSGVKGVSWHKGNKRWRARITVNGECIYLGRFKNKADAVAARHAAADRLHGKYARR